MASRRIPGPAGGLCWPTASDETVIPRNIARLLVKYGERPSVHVTAYRKGAAGTSGHGSSSRAATFFQDCGVTGDRVNIVGLSYVDFRRNQLAKSTL